MIFGRLIKNFLRNKQPMKELIKKVIEEINYKYNSKVDALPTGVPSGIKELDRFTRGFHNGDLIIVAGRPSMGKSAFALSITRHLAVAEKIPVLFFSLDMPKEELAQRALCSSAGVDIHKVRTGYLSISDWPRLTTAAGKLSEAPIFIDDTLEPDINKLRAKVYRLSKKEKVKLIVIDYLQLMHGPAVTGNRQDEISEICWLLKKLAKNLQVPILVISQLSGKVDSHEGYRPQLRDLRKSGPIEKTADLVILLFREEYYEATPESRNRAEIVIAKNRTGPVGSVRLSFSGSYMRFEDLSASER
ncbi:MAG: replicative DNA helicase [Candidatus Omnitrophica bacterium]|nr:replicative DNA helicase [Candidatus Omnitrophota bacterium]